MLKARTGYSKNLDLYGQGQDIAYMATFGLDNPKVGLAFLSSKEDIAPVIKGIKDTTKMPIVGATSSGGIIVPDGIVDGDSFGGMITLNDENMNIGVACHEAGKDPRKVGRRVAIEAVENAKTTRAPSYFYMVATPSHEEEYLLGIQDVIGRVPMFGGSAADEEITNDWKIFCNDKIITDGVAVVFFYTDNEIDTSFTGAYNETDNVGIITKVENERSLIEINGKGALKQYSNWIEVDAKELTGKNLLKASITKPLGIKDPTGNITLIRYPMFSNDQGTKSVMDDTIELGNKVVEKTAIIQLEATQDDLIDSVQSTMKSLNKKLYNESACYILFHCAGRKYAIGNRLEEVYDKVVKEAKGAPFIMAFTYGQYGYDEHSSNMCGGLMLSFTAFGRE